MKNSPFSIHNLNPILVDSVEKAFQRNVEAGRVVGDEFSGSIAKEGLADILKISTGAHNTYTEHGGLENIVDSEIREFFEKTFREEASMFDQIGLPMPDAETFGENGVDFVELANKYDEMDQDLLDPKLVITPYHGSLEIWRKLYAMLAGDPSTILRKNADGDGLWIGNKIIDHWSAIDTLPKNAILPVAVCAGETQDIRWTIRLIPGRDVSMGHYETHAVNGGVHTTIAEYLTLQATRAHAGMFPIDRNSGTWLNGTFAYNAPIGSWQNTSGQVAIGPMDAINPTTNVGFRKPVW